MKILVTGANGLLGHQVINELIRRNEQVHCIVRSVYNIYFDKQKVELSEGDFTDRKALKKSIQGCDAVIHIAAVTSTKLLSSADYYRVNTEATKNLTAVCKECGVKNLVYVSTVNTIGYGSKHVPANEKEPFRTPFTESWYATSKKEAEGIIEAFSSEEGNRAIILHPAFMLGAYDTKPGSGRIILMAYKKPVMLVPGGGKNFVSARAVAIACCNALELGKNGEHYIAGNENLTFRSFYKELARVGGYRQKMYELPNWMIKLTGFAGDLIRRIGIAVDISTINLNQLIIKEFYDSRKAIVELRMPVIALEEAIQEALEWFKKTGKIIN